VFGALTARAGVVALGSLSHHGQRLRLGPARSERDRRISGGYAHSKLAVMTTAIELDRRVRAAGLGIRSVIAHPGYASDANSPVRPGITERSTRAYALAVRRIANTKEEGAAISVHALLRGVGGGSWVEVRAGGASGRVLFRGLLAGGQRRRWESPGPLWMRVGDPTGLRARVHGRPAVFRGVTGDFRVTRAGVTRLP